MKKSVGVSLVRLVVAESAETTKERLRDIKAVTDLDVSVKETSTHIWAQFKYPTVRMDSLAEMVQLFGESNIFCLMQENLQQIQRRTAEIRMKQEIKDRVYGPFKSAKSQIAQRLEELLKL